MRHSENRLMNARSASDVDIPARIEEGVLLSYWRRGWQLWFESMRFRLLILGLMPLLIAFPIIVGVLVVVGGQRADGLLETNLRSNLAGGDSYLDQVKSDIGLRVSQMVREQRLAQLVSQRRDSNELRTLLNTAARSGGLDYLLVATSDGRILASSTQVAIGSRLPDSYVVRQAGIGVSAAAFERISPPFFGAFSPRLGELVAGIGDALLINAGAHFPLGVDSADAILLGGVVLNRNTALIEHLREIIFPVGVLPGDAEGLSGVFVDEKSIVVSRQRRSGVPTDALRIGKDFVRHEGGAANTWIGNGDLGGVSYRIAFSPLLDGMGRTVAQLGVAIPDGPYHRENALVLATVAGLMAVTMLGLSVLFLRVGRSMTERLGKISATMSLVRAGNPGARVPASGFHDEVARLADDFNDLLATIGHQNEMRRVALQAVADEASRRRTLFEHERDGVVILNTDGSVFEANPKAAEMLGYTVSELNSLQLADWDARLGGDLRHGLLNRVGAAGYFGESLHRRRDGTSYAAEVSLSRADWGDQTFVLMVQRDISDRKAVEAELARYRATLELQVEQRTKELNDRSEQLNAIFTLSPDGFVSFDRDMRVSFTNEAFLRMSGLTVAEVIGLDECALSALLAARSLPTASFPDVAMLRRQHLARGEQPDAAEGANRRRQQFELLGPGNRVVEVGIRLSESANVSQILYFRDVTHETEVDRMKSEFLSTAAHELRTPMSSIYGFSQLLMLKQFEREKSQEILRTVVRQSELMISIINELLDLARIEARRGKDFVIVRVPLQEVVQEVIAGFNIPLERQAPVVVVPEDPVFVNIDRRKIQQALLNILSNAYKYSPAGGLVEVAILQGAYDDARRVGVCISDHGLGMTPEQVARVFERFYRADASGNIPGTGLGMCVVKEIVELHGGEVVVSSEYGQGTRVTAWIPLVGAGQPLAQPDVIESEAERLDTW